MATTDKTANQSAKPTAGKRHAFVMENTIDCAASNLAQDDVAQLIDVKAGWLVERVLAEVETAEGGVATFDVGDASDVDGFLDGVDANATGMSVSTLTLTEGAPNTVTGYSAGKLYTADDTIDLLALAAMDAAKITVRAYIVDLNG